MRKTLAILAALGAALFVAVPAASAATARPANWPVPTGSKFDAAPQADPSANFWDDTNDPGDFAYVSSTNSTPLVWNTDGELVAPNGSCAYVDASSANEIDFKTCNYSLESDQWAFGGSEYSGYSVWFSLYYPDGSECVYDQGIGSRADVLDCDGMSSSDRWAWSSP